MAARIPECSLGSAKKSCYLKCNSAANLLIVFDTWVYLVCEYLDVSPKELDFSFGLDAAADRERAANQSFRPAEQRRESGVCAIPRRQFWKFAGADIHSRPWRGEVDNLENRKDSVHSHKHLLGDAQGAMVKWLERLLEKQEDLGLIPAQTKWFFSLLGYRG